MDPPSRATVFRQQIQHVLSAAIRSADPQEAVLANIRRDGEDLCVGTRRYRLDRIKKVVVVGAGKAGSPMAAAAWQVLGDRITGGIVNVKHGHTSGGGGWQVRFGHGDEAARPAHSTDPGTIALVEAGHPVPDADGHAGALRIAGLLRDLTEDDLVLVLISGGGSALLPLPVADITLAEYQALTDLLLRSGAEIREINAVRKHCSRLQGGQLARLAAPARVVALILSDVVGTPLDAIASGPTVPDRNTFAEAWAVLERYQLLDRIPASVRSHLVHGLAGRITETPKPGDELFDRVDNVVIGDNAIAGRAAVAAARQIGYHGALLTTFLQGEAREVGRVVAALAQGIAFGQSDYRPPVCLVLGGETTVTIRGSGMGGRNQELALAAAVALDSYPAPPGLDVAVVSLGTDGSDGPTDAAGGIGTADTLARARVLGLDARAALANNDSYHFFDALGDLIVTGPTQTNVNDLVFVFVSGNPDSNAG